MIIGKRERSSGLGFTDLLFNTLVGFVFLFVISFLLIQPPVPTNKKIDPKSELIIILTWEAGNYSDIDLWVKDPEGNVVSFKRRTAGLMHLDRDDLGAANDTLMLADGTIVAVDENVEVVTIRGWIPGEWTVNVHYYAHRARLSEATGADNPEDVSPNPPKNPIPITVELVRVNPFKEITTAKFELTESGEEVTAFNFTVVQRENGSATPDGTQSYTYSIEYVNNHPTPFVYTDGLTHFEDETGNHPMPIGDTYDPSLWDGMTTQLKKWQQEGTN